MKKITYIFLFLTPYLFSMLNTVVTIAPLKTFVKAIGGDKINITLMVKNGSSPHTYEPKPSQMIKVAKAKLYFSIGVEFEKIWVPKFKNLNQALKIIDVSKNIKKIEMEEDHQENNREKHHHHQELDPHIWTTPKNVTLITKNIYDSLSKIDPKNKIYYHQNLIKFLNKISYTDHKIKNILSHLGKKRTFMVFHPSWGYFAKAYHLRQLPLEIEGKSPKPKAIITLLKVAKKEHINAIFTQPEFSDSVAKTIAHALKIPVIKSSSLAPNWSENLITMAKAIANEL